MIAKPYKLPDPRNQPAAFLVCLYKVLKTVEYDDRAWDKQFFPRCMKRCTDLLETMDEDVRLAAKCMQQLKDKFEAEDTKWTIETVLSYSHEWKSEQLRRTDRDTMRRFLGEYSKDKRIGELKRADAVGLVEKIKTLSEAVLLEKGEPNEPD